MRNCNLRTEVCLHQIFSLSYGILKIRRKFPHSADAPAQLMEDLLSAVSLYIGKKERPVKIRSDSAFPAAFQQPFHLSRIVPVKKILYLTYWNRNGCFYWNRRKYIIYIRKIPGCQRSDITGFYPVQIISEHFPKPIFKKLSTTGTGGAHKKDIPLVPLSVLPF